MQQFDATPIRGYSNCKNARPDPGLDLNRLCTRVSAKHGDSLLPKTGKSNLRVSVKDGDSQLPNPGTPIKVCDGFVVEGPSSAEVER